MAADKKQRHKAANREAALSAGPARGKEQKAVPGITDGGREIKSRYEDKAPGPGGGKDRAHGLAGGGRGDIAHGLAGGMREDRAQLESRTYRLAYEDRDFLGRHALRPQRLALEFMKADMIMRERGIKSTIVVFGGARIPAPGQPPHKAATAEQAKNLAALTPYYEEARRFARICSLYAATTEYREFIIATGGGPGIMEAGNRGACEAGAPNIGLNIVLPHEQAPNPYITPELCFRFHYFAMRKMHFMLRAKALLAFPGGFGTMDELFEVLTLIQTGRMPPVPIVLFGEQFWRQAFNAEFLAEQGMIAPENLQLFTYADTAEAAWQHIARSYNLPAAL